MKKVCQKCNKNKDVSKFGNRKRGLNVLNAYCKACQSQLSKLWRESNRSKYLDYQKDYHKKVVIIKKITNK